MWELENFTTWSEQNFESSSLGDDLLFQSNLTFTNSTNDTQLTGENDDKEENVLNIPYAAMEAIVAICAVIGNALVIIVFHRERRLRRRTNYYIISLALADFLVGLLGIPFAILVRK